MKSNGFNIFNIGTLSVYLLTIVFTIIVLTQSKRVFGQNMENFAQKHSWEIISVLVTLLLFNGLTGLHKFSKKELNKSIITKFIIISLTIGIVVGGIYRASTYIDVIPTDSASTSRMSILNQIMISLLGPQWGLILGVFVVFLLIVFMALFINTDVISINVEGNNNKFMIMSLGMITLIALSVFYMGYKKYKADQNRLNKAKGDITSKPNNTQEIVKMSLIFGLVTPLTLFLSYFLIKGVVSSIKNHNALQAKLDALKAGK